MTREQIRQAVRGLIKAALSLPDAQVLVADSAGTVPAGSDPFLTVNVIDGAAVDHQSAPVAVAGSPRLRVSTQRRVRVSVNAYGYQAEEYLQTVGAVWYSTHPDMDAVRAAGLTPGKPTPIRELRATVDRYPSPRYQVDLIGYHRVTLPTDATIGTIDQIDVDQTLGGVTLPTYTIT